MIEEVKRNATIYCTEKCEFVVFSKEDYKKIIQPAQMKWIDALGMELRQKVFKNVKLQNLRSLISFIQERKCRIGNSLVKRGQPCDGVYIIQSG